ncbi:hypothetical protein ACW5W6_19450, partial [Aeromonas mytilicola]
RLNRNERSHWSGNGVHVESELVFMIGRNMHLLPNPKWFHYFLIQRARVSIMSRPSPSFGSMFEPNITHAADQQSW